MYKYNKALMLSWVGQLLLSSGFHVEESDEFLLVGLHLKIDTLEVKNVIQENNCYSDLNITQHGTKVKVTAK